MVRSSNEISREDCQRSATRTIRSITWECGSLATTIPAWRRRMHTPYGSERRASGLTLDDAALTVFRAFIVVLTDGNQTRRERREVGRWM